MKLAHLRTEPLAVLPILRAGRAGGVFQMDDAAGVDHRHLETAPAHGQAQGNILAFSAIGFVETADIGE